MCVLVSVHSCERKGLVEQHAGTNKTDVVCGKSWRVGPSGRLRRWGARGSLGYPEALVGKEGGEVKARGGGSLELWRASSAVYLWSLGKSLPLSEPQFFHL